MSRSAVVVGAGPNGLAAAIVLARAGRRVTLLEAQETVGGGCRSAELTLPGFVHDTCSTVQSLALASPLLRRLPLADHGLELVHPAAPLAHPLDGGAAVVLERSVAQTAAGLGPDERAYRLMLEPLVRDAEALFGELLAPLRPPRHPLLLARFAGGAVRSAAALAHSRFQGSAPAPCSPAAVRTRCCRCRPRSARRSGSCSPSPPTPSAGPWRGAARSGSPTHWPRTSVPSAGQSRPGAPSSRSTSWRWATGPRCST